MKTYPELVAVVKKEDNDRSSSEAKIGTQRVDVELVEQLRFQTPFG